MREREPSNWREREKRGLGLGRETETDRPGLRESARERELGLEEERKRDLVLPGTKKP